MVLTETGAATAVAKALPELSGKLSGNAIRVPTPNVSMAILNLQLDSKTSKEDINARLRQESLVGPLSKQIDYIYSHDAVSTDFVGSDRAGIVDGLATIVNEGSNGGSNLILYVWYDNENGYSTQVVRAVEKMAGENLPVFPKVEVAAEAKA
jgi:glyceraldehyde 3-phosphate dehydrogenase